MVPSVCPVCRSGVVCVPSLSAGPWGFLGVGARGVGHGGDVRAVCGGGVGGPGVHSRPPRTGMSSMNCSTSAIPWSPPSAAMPAVRAAARSRKRRTPGPSATARSFDSNGVAIWGPPLKPPGCGSRRRRIVRLTYELFNQWGFTPRAAGGAMAYTGRGGARSLSPRKDQPSRRGSSSSTVPARSGAFSTIAQPSFRSITVSTSGTS